MRVGSSDLEGGILRARCSVILILYCLVARPAAAADAHLSGAPCVDAAVSQLDQWETQRTWERVVDGADGARTHRSPTQTIGIWVETRIHGAAGVEILRLTPENTVRIAFKPPACVPKLAILETFHDPAKMAAAFTDEDLSALLAQNKHVVIYAWSPHMPYSSMGLKNAKAAIDALNERREAAGEATIQLVPLLDPHANRLLALRVAKAEGIAKSALRRIESLELLYRGLNQHFPAMLVASEGKITSPVVPGLKTKSFYADYTTEHLRK